jgi:hypothetical protein
MVNSLQTNVRKRRVRSEGGTGSLHLPFLCLFSSSLYVSSSSPSSMCSFIIRRVGFTLRHGRLNCSRPMRLSARGGICHQRRRFARLTVPVIAFFLFCEPDNTIDGAEVAEPATSLSDTGRPKLHLGRRRLGRHRLGCGCRSRL